MTDPAESSAAPRQPVVNLPRVAVLLIAVLVAIHIVRVLVLSPDTDLWVVLTFAFIPVRETIPEVAATVLPGGEAARVWSFVTYAFLHGDWGHLGVNCLWLAAFGAPLAWRFGTARFLLFSLAGAVGGVLLHLAVHPDSVVPVIGASAAISAQMAGACRFVFATGGPLWQMPGRTGAAAYRRPAVPLLQLVRDRRVMVFIAFWFGINLIFGLAGMGAESAGAIAWEAHVGGFLVGLLLFPLFDPVPRVRDGLSPDAL